MKIYVGRWDLLPEDWEGINGLYEKPEWLIKHEIARQYEADMLRNPLGCQFLIGEYTPIQFEETFNGDNERKLNGTDYWIKIF